MSACPQCGVAVVPGYVKCPKCGTHLPAVSRTKSNTFGSGGGTAVDGPGGRSRNLITAFAAVIGIIVIVVIVVAGSSSTKTANATKPTPTTEPDPDQPESIATPNQPTPDEPTPNQPTAVANTDAAAAAEDFDRQLKRQRLWGTVSVIDQRVDVRSASCEDSQMAPVIDAARPQLHGAGLTKLRCLTQSGAVVFERDL